MCNKGTAKLWHQVKLDWMSGFAAGLVSETFCFIIGDQQRTRGRPSGLLIGNRGVHDVSRDFQERQGVLPQQGLHRENVVLLLLTGVIECLTRKSEEYETARKHFHCWS